MTHEYTEAEAHKAATDALAHSEALLDVLAHELENVGEALTYRHGIMVGVGMVAQIIVRDNTLASLPEDDLRNSIGTMLLSLIQALRADDQYKATGSREAQ